MRIRWYVVAMLAIASTRTARAQYNVPSQASGDSLQIAGEEVTIAKSPDHELGWELGASLDFLASDQPLGGRKVKFTDVVLFRAHGLVALGQRTELFAGIDLLPKQPSYTDELVWQSAILGARYRINTPFSTYVRGQVGPVLGRDGTWLAAEAALQYKVDISERTLFWESALGATHTQLFLDEPADRAFWETEMLTQSGIAVRERHGYFAAWLTFTFHFPLIARPEPDSPDPGSGLALDPRTRVGVAIGMVLGVSRSLDLFAEVSILDRGDRYAPATTLPILSGGFDQNRILFGFNKRFGDRRRRRY